MTQEFRPISLSAVNHLAQRLPFDELHRDEVQVVRFADFVDVRDVRMIESGRRLRFANEPLHPITVRSHLGGQNLQRNFAIQLCILRQVNFAHSAFADLRADFVTAESCARGQTMVGHPHFSFSYSFFASIRMDTSASASFQSAKKS